MSRIGQRVLVVPEGVTVGCDNSLVTVKGPKGELNLKLDKLINIEIKDNTVIVKRENESINAKKIIKALNGNRHN